MVVDSPHKKHSHWFAIEGLEYLVHDLVVRYLDSHDQEDVILLISMLNRFSLRGILSGYK